MRNAGAEEGMAADYVDAEVNEDTRKLHGKRDEQSRIHGVHMHRDYTIVSLKMQGVASTETAAPVVRAVAVGQTIVVVIVYVVTLYLTANNTV